MPKVHWDKDGKAIIEKSEKPVKGCNLHQEEKECNDDKASGILGTENKSALDNIKKDLSDSKCESGSHLENDPQLGQICVQNN